MLTLITLQKWLDEFAKAIDNNKDYLSELDLAIGDGDHGGNMVRGITEYRKKLEVKPPQNIAEVFNLMAKAMISKVGGSAGPLYGVAFMNMGKSTVGKEEIKLQELPDLLEEGVKGLKKAGKAELGDKTMLDVWVPVIDNLRNNELTEEVIDKIKEETASLQAKKGRASYLGERSIGHIDAGAASSALLFKTLLNTHSI